MQGHEAHMGINYWLPFCCITAAYDICYELFCNFKRCFFWVSKLFCSALVDTTATFTRVRYSLPYFGYKNSVMLHLLNGSSYLGKKMPMTEAGFQLFVCSILIRLSRESDCDAIFPTNPHSLSICRFPSFSLDSSQLICCLFEATKQR